MAFYFQGVGVSGSFASWVATGDFTISGRVAFNTANSKGLIICRSGGGAPYIGINNGTFAANLNDGAGQFGTYTVTQDEIIEFTLSRVGATNTLTVNGQSVTATSDGAAVEFNSVGNSASGSFNSVDMDLYSLTLDNGADIRDFDSLSFPSSGTTIPESTNSANDISITSGSVSWIEYQSGTGSIVVSNPPYNNYVYQRNSQNQSPVSFPVTFEGSPTALEYRLLDFANNNEITPWQVFDASPSGGNSTLAFNVNVPSAYTKFKVQVRFSDDTAIIGEQSNGWSIGDKILIFGQSLAFHMNSKGAASTLNGYTIFNGTSGVATNEGSGSRELARVLINEDGVAVAILNVAVGSTALIQNDNHPVNYWSNENSTLFTNLVTQMDAFTAGDNRIAAAYWQQGFSDYSQSKTMQEYLDGLNLMMPRVTSRYAGKDSEALPLYIATQGRTYPQDSFPGDEAKQGIRNALITYVAQNDNATQVPVYTSELDDGIHSTSAAYAIVGRMLGFALLGASSYPKVERVFIGDSRDSVILEHDILLDETLTVLDTEGFRVEIDGSPLLVTGVEVTSPQEVTISVGSTIPVDSTLLVYQGYGNGSSAGQLNYPKSEIVTLSNSGISSGLTSDSFRIELTESGSQLTMLHIAQAPVTYSSGANQPPTANAGPDQSVAAGATCILEGSASSDGDGSIVSYSWQKVSGPTIALASANQAVASFIAPSESTIQTLVFELTVTDDDGATSTDTVTVTVAAVPDVADPLDPTLSVFNIKSKVGIEDDNQSFGIASLYQYTDNFILCEVLSKTGTALTPDAFSQAEYRIVDNKGVNVVKLELGAGIKEADGKFLIHINSGILNSSHKGSLKHQFVVWNQAGYKLPPIFGGTVNIIPVLEPTL